MNPDNVHCFGTIFPNLNFVFASICAARPVHIQSDQYRSCSTVNNVTTRSRHSSQWGATKNSAVALSSRNNMISIHQRIVRTNEGKTTVIQNYSKTVSWMVSSFSASCSWRPLDWRIRHSHLASTLFQSRSVVTSAENPAPDNSPQSIGELRNGHVANLQEIYYTRLVRKMAWYKILIHVLIVYFLRITICFLCWWDTKNTSYNWSKQKNPFIW